MGCRTGCVLVFVHALAISGALHAAPTEDLQGLLEQRKSKEAYELGAAHPELLGSPAFDFLFGVAAVDAGHAGEGVLALERYVIRFPTNAVARLQLARGYFILGDDVRARQEFDNALSANPPADTRAVIERYLDTIRLREARYKNAATAYVEIGAGWDSNVNGGVSSPDISLPVLGNVSVLPAGVRQHDKFAHFAAGGQISVPVAPGIAVFGGGDLNAKVNDTRTDFNLATVNVLGGVSAARGRDLYRLSLAHSELDVNDTRFRSLNFVNGEWHHPLDELQLLQLSAQWAKEEYAGANSVRNADFAALSANYRRIFVAQWQPALSVGANLGKEKNTQDRPDLGRDIYGFRAAMDVAPQAKWGVSAGVSYLHSHYDAPDAILGVVRKDKYVAMDASATYLLSRSLSVRGELLASENKSNLELYHFRRTVASVKLRYDFK